MRKESLSKVERRQKKKIDKKISEETLNNTRLLNELDIGFGSEINLNRRRRKR